MVGSETLYITLTTEKIGHASPINTQRTYIYFAQLRHHEENTCLKINKHSLG